MKSDPHISTANLGQAGPPLEGSAPVQHAKARGNILQKRKEDVALIVKRTIARCRETGLRRTKALEELIYALVEEGRPMTMIELAACDRLSDQCDKASVCRLLRRLVDYNLARRLGLHTRAAHYALLLPGIPQHYLICKTCGRIEGITDAPT